MLFEIILLIISLFLLVKGADWLVEGAAEIASRLRIPPIYVGLTVVAFGTSLPEMIVSLIAVLTNKPGISFGNIIGSNIANIGLIIGISAIIYPLIVKRKTLTYEFPILVILSFLIAILANKNYIFQKNEFFLGRIDGIILLIIFGIFLYYIFESIKKDKKELKNKVEIDLENLHSIKRNILFLIIGPIMLFLGGKFFVDAASTIARKLNIPEVIIGLTIVSVGTSLPELFTSAIAAFKKQSDIAIGNIVGSNIFNIAWVLGLVSLIKNISIESKTIYVDSVVMIGFTLIFLLYSAKSKKIGRLQGISLLIGYLIYVAYLFL